MPGAGQVESIPASKRNFAVYKARPVERTYLVVSMSAVRKDPEDPPKLKDHFQGSDGPGPTDKMLIQLADELAAEQASTGGPVELTLKVHGYNTRRKTFEWELLRDADPAGYYRLCGKKSPPGLEADRETFRPPRRFLVGFRWPSEGMSSRGSWRDTLEAILMTPTIGWALLLLPLAALLFSGNVAASLRSCWGGLASVLDAISAKGWGIWTQLDQVLPALTVILGPYRDAGTAGVLLGVGLLFVALRLSTYPRDRYRAIHYGVPDLGEFMRALEGELVKRKTKVVLDVVGHSMGSLVLINAFRVMSDYFSRPGDPSFGGPTLGRNGTYELRTMVLCAPDLPAVMATPDRNNYFLSVLRRFRSLHIFSSDRDIILKWFSLLGNWISEPRHDMAGRRLGNVVLVRARPQSLRPRDSRADWSLVPVSRPVWRDFQLYRTDPLSEARPAELHFHDCTCQSSMSGSMPWHLASSSLLLAALWGLSRLVCPAPFQWLFWVLTLFWGLGTACRLAWPRLRDHGRLGGLSGLFADWTSLTMFLTFKVGWNPHSGYFMVGSPARRRIAGLLKDPELYPSSEEEDGPIRYRRVLVSV